MNRENKRKQYQNGYYKNHRCDDTFTCKHCGRVVVPVGAGTQHRNHCPNCLTSLHLDNEPGDRAADCGGQMEPVAVWVRKGGEWAIIHRLPPLRQTDIQPHRRRRQPDASHEHRHAPALHPAVPAGAHRGDDGTDGRGGAYAVMRGVGDADPCTDPDATFRLQISPMCYTE